MDCKEFDKSSNKIKTWIGFFSSKIFEKDMYDIELPKYLEESITQLLKGIKENNSLLDCLLDEVSGSINSAFWDGTLTEKHASHLRNKYLYYEKD